jgi:hypothetical protein
LFDATDTTAIPPACIWTEGFSISIPSKAIIEMLAEFGTEFAYLSGELFPFLNSDIIAVPALLRIVRRW